MDPLLCERSIKIDHSLRIKKLGKISFKLNEAPASAIITSESSNINNKQQKEEEKRDRTFLFAKRTRFLTLD